MDTPTLRSRLVELMQRSRKAMRLYASVGRGQQSKGGAPRANVEFSELQAEEWKLVNAELLKQLGLALDEANPKKIVAIVLAVHERFGAEFRRMEAELHLKQKELSLAAESGDFIKAAVTSRQLVILKARLQATQAAHHELDEVVRRCKLTPDTIELAMETIVPEGNRIAPAAKEYPINNPDQFVIQRLEQDLADLKRASGAPTTSPSPGRIEGGAKIIPLRKRTAS